MITYLDAEDELNGSVQVAWNAAVAALGDNAPSVPTIIYDGQAVPDPDSGATYSQPSLVVLQRPQKTLRRINNLSIFESTCIYTLRIFAPQSQANGRENAIRLGMAICQVVSKASPSGSLWYRDAKATPVPGPVGLSQVNVTSTVVFESEE
jgi:hypothetical protein